MKKVQKAAAEESRAEQQEMEAAEGERSNGERHFEAAHGGRNPKPRTRARARKVRFTTDCFRLEQCRDPCCFISSGIEESWRKQGSVAPLTRVKDDPLVGAVGENQGWVHVPITVDSGAAESVIPLDYVREYEVKPPSRPEYFQSATGEKIENHGQ